MELIKKNFNLVISNIEKSAQKTKKTLNDITLVAVTKKQPITKINYYLQLYKELFPNAIPIIGENYLQEYLSKKNNISLPHKCHLIGHLQSNKAKKAVQVFDCIETIDSKKIASLLNKECYKLNIKKDVFIQINISQDPNKYGLKEEEVDNFTQDILNGNFPNLNFLGLMTITENYYGNKDKAEKDFVKMKLIYDKINAKYNNKLRFLSMGMSSDYDIAIQNGANLVRIGSAIFGPRKNP